MIKMNDKILLICDTHFGAKSDSVTLLDYQKKFYDTIFFPYIDKHQIDTIVHLGDLVDRRKFVNYYTAFRMEQDFMRPIFDRNIDFHIICGNHDTFYKNTNQHNSITRLYGADRDKFHIYTNPKEVSIKGLDFLMLPWICDDNYDQTLELCRTSDAEYVISHLELSGFEMDRGNISHSGMDKSLFDRFAKVYSGHFHHKSSIENITYLGAPCQYTWVDYDDPKGFHVINGDKRTLDYVKNPLELYKKFYYDDINRSKPEEMQDFDPSIFTGTYTKIVVKNKNNPYLLDLVISKIESGSPVDVSVIDDTMDINMFQLDDTDNLENAQDTVSLLKKYIESVDSPVDKIKIEQFMSGLYVEALNQES
jgi:DNA repair exonuclease SbcCD nuclease subunit